MTLCISTRDELRMVDLQEVAFLKADGNYTDFYFNDGKVVSEAFYLYQIEQMIADVFSPPSDKRSLRRSPFYRLGRSCIVNVEEVQLINLQTQQLMFRSANVVTLQFSKRLLKDLKDYSLSYFSGMREAEQTPFTHKTP